MVTVTETAIIRRPPSEVFTVAADPERQLEWDADTLKRVEKLTPGPLGQGSRYRGEFKGFGTVEYEFERYEEDRAFSHHATIKVGDMRHVFTFDPVPEGTRMTQEARLEPRGIGKVMSPLMRRMFAKRFRTIADEIGEYLDRQPGEA